MSRRVRAVVVAAVGVLPVACGPLGSNTQREAYNSRDTGPWVSLGRLQGSNGSLVVHVAAAQPEHAEAIAHKIVRQNYATSAHPIRVIIDPMVGDGERYAYRWDGATLAPDRSAEPLPPRAPRPGADGAEALQ